METLFQLQLPLMVFLQNISTSFLDVMAEIITIFGESPIPLLVTIFIYWCIDKKKGFVIVSSLMSAMMSMQLLKAIFRVPRPFMEYPDLIKGKRQSTATGFSFPSGHSTTAAAFYGSLAYNYKQKWIRAICTILIILVPISRLYLGVHWPLDILIGALIGILSAFYLGKIFANLYEKEKPFLYFCIIFAIIAMAISSVLAISMDIINSGYADIGSFKESDFYRATHNLMQNSAIAFGLFLGMFLDRKYLRFIPARSIRNRILSMAIGIISAAIIAGVLMLIPILKYTFEFVLFAFIGIWATFVFPFIATKLNIMGKEI